MNYGPLIFLAAFFAMAASWFGFILKPQVETGFMVQTNSVPGGATYPQARSGLAQQGLQVYRANGCASCHSQQVGQTGTVCDLILTAASSNQTSIVKTLVALNPMLTEVDATQLLGRLPQTVAEGLRRDEAELGYKALKKRGAKVELHVRPVGPDIARGWGVRRSVAEDFLFDSPVMLGSQRIGPDLANIGLRNTDVNWHLRHLYAPRLDVPGSTMPPYRFLFEKHRINQAPSPEALTLSGSLAPEPGYEIVPRSEAFALVAYLASLRADVALFDAPVTLPEPVAPSTNAPAATPAAK